MLRYAECIFDQSVARRVSFRIYDGEDVEAIRLIPRAMSGSIGTGRSRDTALFL